MAELISVIVTTYNREDALDAVLRSLSRQTDAGFEIVVADDGSRPATARVVETWTTRLPVAVRHVWQEDRGFRAAEIRNRGNRGSAGATASFSTAIASPGRIRRAHRRLAEPGYFVTGNRVLLSPALTASASWRAVGSSPRAGGPWTASGAAPDAEISTASLR